MEGSFLGMSEGWEGMLWMAAVVARRTCGRGAVGRG